MVIAVLIFVVGGAIHVGVRQYNKRQAKKHGYDTILEHDTLWRPLNKKGGKRITKREARLLAKANQSAFTEDVVVTDDTPPPYIDYSIEASPKYSAKKGGNQIARAH
ncbi:uncharacterized protein FA14DRAFT_52074 [Meira miltonrushii]|uniref:Uncharacterized protein n=1 Tax=Meira miltonrushii TaxID=1280837 RepID=A0A316VGD6_9BASI|nr:uncharacterized protein FA14DRAFT_52074 [Meira miltonrushii]PWN36128.1 hypothetical protein FA14DRAFT_52074 [Meira miltonrushii]